MSRSSAAIVTGAAMGSSPPTAAASARGLRVLRIIARLNVGGPARHAMVLDRGLQADGVESLLVHGSVGPDEGSLEDLVADRCLRTVKIPELGPLMRPGSDLRALYQLTRVIFRERPDVVHTHTAKAGTLGRIAAHVYNVTRRRARRCAVVHTFHGHVFSGYFGPSASAAARLVERGVALVTDRVVTISESQRTDICHRYRVAPPWKTEVIELGLELDPLLARQPATGLRGALGFGPRDVVFGYVGRFVPIKNLSMLIRAFARVAAQLPEARLVLVGDGELREALASLVADLGLGAHVRFTGWRSDLVEVYGSMDVGVLSSRNEGTPVALIEAMAAGKPVIATAVGGVGDVVDHERTGLIVPSDDVDGLVAAMVRLVKSPDERRRFGGEARRAIGRRFSPDRLVSEISGLYLRALVDRRALKPEHAWARLAPPTRPRVMSVIARLNVGGPARHATVLGEALRTHGFEPLLVHGSVDAGEGSLEDLVVERRLRAFYIPELGRRIQPWGDLRALSQLLRLMFRERPDVVHTHTAKAGTLGRLAALAYNATRPRARRCVVVHTFHGHIFSGYFSPIASAAVRLVERAMAGISDRIVTISDSQRYDICQRYGIAPPGKTEVVELGIELDTLLELQVDRSLRDPLGFGPHDVVFGYVGRLVPIKNLHLLIQAFGRVAARLPDVRLMLVGDGELRRDLEDLVRTLGVREHVRFTGWRRDLEAVYGAMDVCVLSSRSEGTPVALIEAMAAGRPVIATAVGGVEDVVDDGRSGLVVPPDDLERLADAMLRLARDPAERRRLGSAGRLEMAGRFHPDRLVAETGRLYLEALTEKRRLGTPGRVPAVRQAPPL